MRQSTLILILALALPARAHWTPAARPSPRGLSSVCALSSSAVWAAGEAGGAYFSEDGGASWMPQATGLTADLLSVSFAAPRAGWISGAGGAAAFTQDGGGLWTRQTVAVDDYGLGAPDAVAPVAATSAASAWALARWNDVTAVCHTGDAGQTWTPTRYTNHSYFAPNTVYTLSASADAQAWLLASRITAAGDYEPVLLRTQNTGASWEIVPLPATAVNQPTNPHWETAMAAVSASDVWAYARDPSRETGVLFHATQGTGSAWTVASWDVNAALRTMRFADGAHGILVGDATLQTTNAFAAVRRAPNPGGVSLAASFASETDGFAVSPDGGAWRWVADAPGDVDGAGSVDLPDAVAALRILASGGQTDSLTKAIADVAPPGGDGQITAADVISILKTVGGTRQ